MTTDLTTVLADCAAAIRSANERFAKDFVGWIGVVGAKLKTAQDELAKPGSPDGAFVKWLEMETPFRKTCVYQLIDAHGIIESLSAVAERLPANERQCRELACIPEDKLPKVWQAIVDRGDPITAKLIREHTDDWRDAPAEVPIDRQWDSMRSRIRKWANQWGAETPLAYLEDLIAELRERAE